MIDLVAKLDEATAKKIKAWGHPKNRASEAGHPCERFLVASRTHGKLKALHGVSLQRIFDEGNIQEAAMLREIQDAGIRVVEQQRPFDWPAFELSGRIDAMIETDDGLIPLECKSCSPNVFRCINRMAPVDFINAKQPWLRKYPAQLYCYDMMTESEKSAMLFKNKVSGEKRQIDFVLDDPALIYTESILQKLARVNAHVKAGSLPDVVRCEDCRDCGFAKTLCFPDVEYGPGFVPISDSDLEAKLDRREELEEAVEEYKDIDAEIKESVQGKNLVVGKWKVESRELERHSTKIPDELKKQFEVVTKYWKVTIERI
jgi:hypothetical protein